MDQTINHVHSIELHGAAVWVLIIVLAVIAVRMVAPMVTPLFSVPPSTQRGPMGFHK